MTQSQPQPFSSFEWQQKKGFYILNFFLSIFVYLFWVSGPHLAVIRAYSQLSSWITLGSTWKSTHIIIPGFKKGTSHQQGKNSSPCAISPMFLNC